MYLARVICSDGACAEEALVEAADAMELATLLCEACGCLVEVRGLPDWVEEPAPSPLAFPVRRGGVLDLAA